MAMIAQQERAARYRNTAQNAKGNEIESHWQLPRCSLPIQLCGVKIAQTGLSLGYEESMMKIAYRVGLMVGVVAASALAVAQTATVAKNAAEAKVAIEARQAHFEDIKKTFEPLGAMLKRQKELDAELVATNSTRLVAQANAIPAKFSVDTRQFKDTKTDSRDAVWASAADFKTKSDAMAAAAAAAATVAKTGNKGETLKALGAIGRTCGACHDNFKAES